MIEPFDEDRYPALSDAGRQMLHFLREHPHAPRFHNESGHRLRPEELEQLQSFEREVAAADLRGNAGEPQAWVEQFLDHAWPQVPHFRQRGTRPVRLCEIAPTSRADFGRDIASFVPDDVATDRMINFRTSGTSGHPLLLASHPVVAARYLAFHRRALRRFGIELRHGQGQVGVVLVGFQRKCFTYVSVTPFMNESGLAKINLHPEDWRHSDDRGKYLDALQAEVLTGDPLSFAELLNIATSVRPRALFSTSMALLPGMRARLEQRFECPVLDLYSMNEAGPIAVFDPRVGGHVLLQNQLFVEILDPAGRTLEEGQRGEITLTGGFNFCLPLIRYRTGDFATLARTPQGEPMLVDLLGRPPVRFRTGSGEWVNNIEVTHALQRLALPQFTLHQGTDGVLSFRSAGGESSEIEAALRRLFGPSAMLHLDVHAAFADKVIQYTSDLPEAAP